MASRRVTELRPGARAETRRAVGPGGLVDVVLRHLLTR